MYELKNVSSKSAARVLSFVAVIIYVIFAVISLVTGTMTFGTGTVSLVIGIVLFGVIGALLGLVVAWGYNFAAQRWGGLYLDFKLLEDEHEPEEAQKKEAPNPSEDKNQNT